MSGDDDFLSLVDHEAVAGPPPAPPWRLLIVDDVRDVHAITKLALTDFTFQGRPLTFLSACSAREAEALLRRSPDIAVVLLDVVMETEDAGLRLTRTIREELGNADIRIILRTGQSGRIPERSVISNYDINDYLRKGDLSADRLFTSVTTALRSYQHIRRLETTKLGMAAVIDAAGEMFRSSTMHRFLETAIARLSVVVGGCDDLLFCARQRNHVTLKDETVVINARGRYAAGVSHPVLEVLGQDEVHAVEQVISDGRPAVTNGRSILPLSAPGRWSGAILLPLNLAEDPDRHAVVDLFMMVTAAAVDTFYLLDEMRRSKKATVVALADIAENRDSDTGEHVLRVGRMALDLTRELRRHGPYASEIDDLFLEAIGASSMLHDIGKVGLPDHVLKKSGQLDRDERRLMETHTVIGSRTLDKVRRLVCASRYLDLGRDAALYHHEHFDGGGYPHGLKGLDIPLVGRIVAVADVFDALISPRVYKPAWPLADAIAHIVSNAGRQFDPVVVAAFQTTMTRRLMDERIRWMSDWSVGSGELDEDHRRLTMLVNQLAVADDGDDRAMMEAVIDELIQYTEVHFRKEEDYMSRIGFPQLDQHREQHDFLTRQVMAFRTRFFNGLPGKLNDEIVAFLSDWLSRHIQGEDQQYRLFFQQSQTADAAASPGACAVTAARTSISRDFNKKV